MGEDVLNKNILLQKAVFLNFCIFVTPAMF